MSQLFLSNVPWNCQDSEVRQWIESKGYPVDSIDVVRDLVANASPAFAYVTLRDSTEITAAVKALNGEKLKDRILQVKEDWRATGKGGAAPGANLVKKEKSKL